MNLIKFGIATILIFASSGSIMTVMFTQMNMIRIEGIMQWFHFLLNTFNITFKIRIMRFFSKENAITETKCKECGMEFSEPERMLRHMIKAHTKKKPSCNC